MQAIQPLLWERITSNLCQSKHNIFPITQYDNIIMVICLAFPQVWPQCLQDIREQNRCLWRLCKTNYIKLIKLLHGLYLLATRVSSSLLEIYFPNSVTIKPLQLCLLVLFHFILISKQAYSDRR